MTNTNTVILGNINAGELRVEFVVAMQQSLTSTPDSPAVLSGTLFKTWGPYLDDSRNFVVDAFLRDTDIDVLLFVDSDIGWDKEHVSELVHHINLERPCVGGLYYSGMADKGQGTPGIYPVAYNWGTHSETKQPFLIPLDDSQFGDQDLIKVDGIGTGFLAIHRSLLLRMVDEFPGTQPWFAEEDFQNVHHGEDFTFCLRLASIGVPVYLAPKVRVRHHKVVAF